MGQHTFSPLSRLELAIRAVQFIPRRRLKYLPIQIEKVSLTSWHLPVCPCPEESELAPCWVAELAWERQDEENGFNGGRWV